MAATSTSLSSGLARQRYRSRTGTTVSLDKLLEQVQNITGHPAGVEVLFDSPAAGCAHGPRALGMAPQQPELRGHVSGVVRTVQQSGRVAIALLAPQQDRSGRALRPWRLEPAISEPCLPKLVRTDVPTQESEPG